MQTFVDPHLLARLRVGPLASYLDAYLKRIEQQGYLSSSVPMQMYAIARFSRWLQAQQLDLNQVDEVAVERFCNVTRTGLMAEKLRLYGAFWRCCVRLG
jgi:hypothetical protein